MAFISFHDSEYRDKIIDANPYTPTERIKNWLYNGKLKRTSDDELYWDENRLFIEPAPEPNDVDWEFIHCTTKEKLIGRAKSYLYNFLFMGSFFMVIFGISKWQGKMIDQAHEAAAEGKGD